MSNILLYLMTAALPVIGLAALVRHLWNRAHPQDLTVTEWRARMAKLEPLPPPKFLSKYTSHGAAGVCFPEPKSTKMTVVKRRAIK